METLIGRMAGVLAGWTEGPYAFDPGPEAVPPEAVGPLPTAELVMASSTLGLGAAELLARVGGEAALWVASQTGEERARAVRLAAAEVALRERLREPQAVAELLVGVRDQGEILRRLCRLEALALVERAEPRSRGEALVTPDVVQRFADRVAGELRARPLELDLSAHRARIAGLLARLGELDHYRLLGLATEARTEDVHTAYAELARVVHPCHAARLGLAGREEALNLLFERATEAYLVLTDPLRRGRYNAEMAIMPIPTVGGDGPPPDPAALRQLGVQLFGRAREMVDKEEYHYAVELLRRAVQADPRAEYYALLAQVQQRNPNWLRHAADSLREAVAREPDSLPLRLELAALVERLGDKERARAAYRSILARHPGNAEAAGALERLGDPTVQKTRRPGLLRSLFGGE
jgi:curved DNA-binding protein CbpA